MMYQWGRVLPMNYFTNLMLTSKVKNWFFSFNMRFHLRASLFLVLKLIPLIIVHFGVFLGPSICCLSNILFLNWLFNCLPHFYFGCVFAIWCWIYRFHDFFSHLENRNPDTTKWSKICHQMVRRLIFGKVSGLLLFGCMPLLPHFRDARSPALKIRKLSCKKPKCDRIFYFTM